MSAAQAYLLRFRLLRDAEADARKRFSSVHRDFLSINQVRFDPYIRSWIQVLESEGAGRGVDRQYLRRAEGGIGGNDNWSCRQMRLFNRLSSKLKRWNFREITIRAEPSLDAIEVWTRDELLEFGEAFKRVIEERVAPGSIDFYIALCMP